jgi:hypothetical protein
MKFWHITEGKGHSMTDTPLEHIRIAVAEAELRTRRVNDSRDAEIREMCERLGYGAVMDTAMRLWIKKDPDGAFYIGGCLGYAKAVIREAEKKKP